MQVNMDRPRGLAKLLGGLVEQRNAENNQLLGIFKEKVKKEQLQNLSSSYLKQFSEANGDVMKMIGANSTLASGLFGMGEFDSGMKIIGSNNTLALKLYEQNNPKPPSPVTLLDKDGNPVVVYPQGPDTPAKVAPGIVTSKGEPAPSGLVTPQVFTQKKTDERLDKTIKASDERTNKVISATDKRQQETIDQQNKVRAQENERADINLINTHLAAIKELKNKKADWEKKITTAETEEEKAAIKKNVDDIDVQLTERDAIIKNTQRKYPHWKQPGQSSQQPQSSSQNSAKPLSTRNDGKVKVKLSDGRMGFIDPKEFNSSTMTYVK